MAWPKGKKQSPETVAKRKAHWTEEKKKEFRKTRQVTIAPPWLYTEYKRYQEEFGSKEAREWLNWKLFGLLEPDDE